MADSALIENIPVLPLRDMVVYPHGVHPLFVGTESSIRALDAAMSDDKQILLLAKRDPDNDDPKPTDLFELGTAQPHDLFPSHSGLDGERLELGVLHQV